MRGRGLLVVLAGAMALALVGAGCGGGDSGAEGSAASAEVHPTKKAFLKQAEAVCVKNYERVKKEYEAFVNANGGPKNAFEEPDTTAEYVDDVIVPEKKRTVEELKALGAPTGDEKAVGEIIEAYEEGIEVAEEDPERATTSTGVFAYATHVAEEYGLKSCLY